MEAQGTAGTDKAYNASNCVQYVQGYGAGGAASSIIASYSPSFPSPSADMQIKKVANGFILNIAGNQYVFTTFAPMFKFIETYYKEEK